jgi:hypothetical protein
MTADIKAIQATYRAEIINGFDKTASVLRESVTTEYMDKGGSAIFCVADTANQTARTRGYTGQIVADPLALTQNTATLAPWHKLVTVNDFNMFASQGDLAKPMQAAVMASINRKIDDEIITILNTGTVAANTTARVGDIHLVTHARAILGASKVPNDGQVTLLATPALLTYMQRAPEFSSADYVSARPFVDGGPAFGDKRMVYKWNNMTIIEDPTLPGIGTAAEKCFLFHKSAIGQAINKNALDFDMDYNREQKYSWANCSAYLGTVLLQNSGIVVLNHDGSALSAAA